MAILENSGSRTAAAPVADTRTRVFDLISFVARFYMAYIWIVAGLFKIFESKMEMAQAIQAYDIFTNDFAYGLAHLIGPLELAGGLFLLFGVFLRKSALVGNIVLVLFVIGIAQAWARGIELNCGCFSAESAAMNYPLQYAQTIGRDIFYIALMTWTMYRPFTKWSVKP